jgi:hypothetical protein
MRSGLHGENGLDPVTSISILRTYVIPIMFYGLETLLPSGKSFETLEKQYNKMMYNSRLDFFRFSSIVAVLESLKCL